MAEITGFVLAYGDATMPREAYKLLLEARNVNSDPSALVIPMPQTKSYGTATMAGDRAIRFLEQHEKEAT